jgi:hypothetical protein
VVGVGGESGGVAGDEPVLVVDARLVHIPAECRHFARTAIMVEDGMIEDRL